MAKEELTSRRVLDLGLVGCVPVGRLARAAAPVVGPLLRTPSAQAPSLRDAALADLSVALGEQSDLRAFLQSLDSAAEQMRQHLARSPQVNQDALRDQLARLGSVLSELDAQMSKIELLALKISQVQSGGLPGSAADAGDTSACVTVNRQLFAAGYIDNVQVAALARGQFMWTANEIYAALARGCSAADRVTAPIAARLAANQALLVLPGPLQAAPTGRAP